MATGTAADVVMPQMGVSVSEGTITKWLKSEGDPVAADEPLLEISTDKVDTEVPAPASGVLGPILVPEGETVDVGTPLATIVPAGADAPSRTEHRRHRALRFCIRGSRRGAAGGGSCRARGAAHARAGRRRPPPTTRETATAGAPSSPPSSPGSRASTISTSRSSPAPAAAAG